MRQMYDMHSVANQLFSFVFSLFLRSFVWFSLFRVCPFANGIENDHFTYSYVQENKKLNEIQSNWFALCEIAATRKTQQNQNHRDFNSSRCLFFFFASPSFNLLFVAEKRTHSLGIRGLSGSAISPLDSLGLRSESFVRVFRSVFLFPLVAVAADV